MKKYKYKNIDLFLSGAKWQADYTENGKRFALHRYCCKTKAEAYSVAKIQVDFLNKQHKESETLEKAYLKEIEVIV